jgi:hypothetical protein
MAEIKFTLDSSDKIKALLGDLNVEIEIPASAFFDFVKGQMTLQDVTNNGAVTTDDVTVNKLITLNGIQFPFATLVNVNIAEAVPIAPDSNIELTIEDITYILSAQIKS